jgi:WXXGXW repeat (2 copies)
MCKIVIRTLLLALFVSIASIPAHAQVVVGVSVSFAPPAIPVYDQPICPGDGYIWTPGYWAWDADFNDYYWVPGTWVEAPAVGLLWTPGFWAWNGGAFVFTDGYWGPVVGFYGGINYGFGYFGTGFVGGRWDGGHFFYNTAVWHVNETVVHNTYVERVTIVNNNRVSYNGGNGGINVRPTPQEEAARDERHVAAVAAQQQQMEAARGNQSLRASANHGKPPIAATVRPGAFNDHVVKAKDAGAPYNPPPNRNAANANERAENNPGERSNGEVTRPTQPNAMSTNRPENNGSNNAVIHPKDLPAYEKPPAPNTGNPKLDQKYQQQQEKLAQQQENERQKLQQQQDKEHQQYQKQRPDEAKTQALEQKHQQQTQQLQQRQQAAQQELQKRQSPPPSAHAAPAEHSAPAEGKEEK